MKILPSNSSLWLAPFLPPVCLPHSLHISWDHNIVLSETLMVVLPMQIFWPEIVGFLYLGSSLNFPTTSSPVLCFNANHGLQPGQTSHWPRMPTCSSSVPVSQWNHPESVPDLRPANLILAFRNASGETLGSTSSTMLPDLFLLSPLNSYNNWVFPGF